MKELRLLAHPEYYDYMHSITFLDDVRVELFYGECQAARYEAVGDYSMTDTTLTIMNLKEVDSNIDDNSKDNENTALKNEAKLTDTASGQQGTLVYNFRKEIGKYEWADDLTGEKRSASERYVFDQDPCGMDDGQVIFYKT